MRHRVLRASKLTSLLLLAGLSTALAPAAVSAGVEPLLPTRWGQGAKYQEFTPKKNRAGTHPGCTTIAAAQILYYYRASAPLAAPWIDGDECYYLEHAPLDPGSGWAGSAAGAVNEHGDELCVDFSSYAPNWANMALTDKEAKAKVSETAKFIYNVAVVMHLQFGGGEGASSTGRFIQDGFERTFKYPRSSRAAGTPKLIRTDVFFTSSTALATALKAELDAGRPVMYMAQEADRNIGHAFVIDGYADSGANAGKFHVNWGWGGIHDGYYDLSFTDPSGRSWSRNAMIYQFLAPPGWKKPSGGTGGGTVTPPPVTRDRSAIIVAVANDPRVTAEVLRGIGITKLVASDIVAGRGATGYANLDAVDALPGVGPATLDKLHKYGVDNGYDTP